MVEISNNLQPLNKHVLKGKVQLATILTTNPRDFAKLIKEIEDSSIFKKLFSTPSSSRFKVIQRRNFSHAKLSTQFYELDENLPASRSQDSVEKILDSKKNLIELIKKIGEKNFEKYFLYSNGEAKEDEIERECGISSKEIGKINDLVNQVFVEEETLSGSKSFAPEKYFTKVAQIIPEENQNFFIAFYSPRMAQGIYQVNHEKLKELKENRLLSREEKKELHSLLSKISLVNLMKNSLYLLLLKIIERQKNYFLNENSENLNILTQKELAKEIGISQSTLSRLISSRSLDSPSGQETPLSFFFNSRKDWVKKRLKNILQNEIRLTDSQIGDIIKKNYAIHLSRRTINQYRKELTHG
ncbi:MAG: hypothetical protein A3I11_08650 [Elusimicrobia bacterium RIFCSPLOWO2_02_FULL_39_32]|nr:MAG: hypothetical protein A2034_06365 [Elusimicrobia bacterium GWA2_38_7]OGR79825.1 MAG: hypothetical protein A3B80_03540 [Elusimicrobia bacterium RIFCSPHIGHO2_02_FULL_39_36]OGR93076.1 MAG: hypothetical protein A3I11_08650 [Elusimicrobia bacterium RIFCSPLOWO2_02_FULL_39_32]OGS00359.1 MAG: hypothetical protein A3G85_00045 [Elusimicrobia bacterium RIFCSPLOWO2_12_FULL_39_28]